MMSVLPCCYGDCTLQAHDYSGDHGGQSCEMCAAHCYDAALFQNIVELLRAYPYPKVIGVLEILLTEGGE